MPVYANASATEPVPLSRELPPEKRIELYEFEFENDENEVPAKKPKKRKPRVKQKGTKFFENLGKAVLPPVKAKKVPKKCAEEQTKRVLPKRGALRQIAPLENQRRPQSVSVLSKGTSFASSSLKSEEPTCTSLASSVNSFGSISTSNVQLSNISTLSSAIGNTSKHSSHSNLFSPNTSISFTQAVPKPAPSYGNIPHQISFNDLNESLALEQSQSPKKPSPVAHDFKMPATVTVRNLRTRQKKNNFPRCSSPKKPIVRSSSPLTSKQLRSSSPCNNGSPNRTLLFGATSPISRQNSSSVSLSSLGAETQSLNDIAGSGKSFDSSIRSFDRTCLIAGNQDDSYKSVGEDDLCQFFGFDEEELEENEENACRSSAKNVETAPKRRERKKTKVESDKSKTLEKPPVEEVLSLLKSSVPVDSNMADCELEPFSLSPQIWSPIKSQPLPTEEVKDRTAKPAGSSKRCGQTKVALKELSSNGMNDAEEEEAAGSKSRKGRTRRPEKCASEDNDADQSIANKSEVAIDRRCRTKQKTVDTKKREKPDESLEERTKTTSNVYKAPKRKKEANKAGKEKAESEGNGKEMDEFEALAASLNSQFQEIENFQLAVE